MKQFINNHFLSICIGLGLVCALCVVMIVTGAKQDADKNTPSDITSTETATPTTAVASKPTEAPTEAPTDTPVPTPEDTPTPTPNPHAGMVRSALTNEWIAKEIDETRPIAVMMNNLLPGTPQSSINKAGVVYELKVEGNITRLLAIIEDWKGLDKIGSVRSARKTYVFLQMEWDPIYLHFGNSNVAQPFLNRADVLNLDGMLYEGKVYYRSTDRKAPHNAYASAEGILWGVEHKNYSLQHADHYVRDHFKFADDDAPTLLSDGTDARIVRPGYQENTPWFQYNADDGLYYRFQYGKEHIDNVDNKQITCKNIILQYCASEVVDDAGHKVFTIHGSGKGYFITNGKAVPITWKKNGDYDPTRFYYQNGEEIKLNTGKTWICIVRNQDVNTVKIEK